MWYLRIIVYCVMRKLCVYGHHNASDTDKTQRQSNMLYLKRMKNFQVLCYEYYFRNDLFITFGQKTLINNIAAPSRRNDCYVWYFVRQWMDVDGRMVHRTANKQIHRQRKTSWKEKLLQFEHSSADGRQRRCQTIKHVDLRLCNRQRLAKCVHAMMRHKHMVNFEKNTTKVEIALILLSGLRIIMNRFRILRSECDNARQPPRCMGNKINVFLSEW